MIKQRSGDSLFFYFNISSGILREASVGMRAGPVHGMYNTLIMSTKRQTCVPDNWRTYDS